MALAPQSPNCSRIKFGAIVGAIEWQDWNSVQFDRTRARQGNTAISPPSLEAREGMIDAEEYSRNRTEPSAKAQFAPAG